MGSVHGFYTNQINDYFFDLDIVKIDFVMTLTGN